MMFLSEEARDTLNDGQVFGCEFYPAFDDENKLDVSFSWDKACFILQVWQS